jgi:hypothetical protein
MCSAEEYYLILSQEFSLENFVRRLVWRDMSKVLKLKFILPSIQIILTITAVIIDQSFNRGFGEGTNQVRANLLSNIEFFIKSFLGYDDIVNYNFRLVTALLAIGFWYLVGLAIDKLIGNYKRFKMKTSFRSPGNVSSNKAERV